MSLMLQLYIGHFIGSRYRVLKWLNHSDSFKQPFSILLKFTRESITFTYLYVVLVCECLYTCIHICGYFMNAYVQMCLYLYSPHTQTIIEPYRINNQDSCQISNLQCVTFREGEMMSEIKLQSQYQKKSIIIGTELYSVLGRSFY